MNGWAFFKSGLVRAVHADQMDGIFGIIVGLLPTPSINIPKPNILAISQVSPNILHSVQSNTLALQPPLCLLFPLIRLNIIPKQQNVTNAALACVAITITFAV